MVEKDEIWKISQDGECRCLKARESQVYNLAECHSISSCQFRAWLISSCRLLGLLGGCQPFVSRQVDSSMQGTRLYADRGYQSRHGNDNHKNGETNGSGNGVGTPFHSSKPVIIYIKVGMSCECIEIHNWISTLARIDATLHEPHHHLIKCIRTHGP